MYVHSCLNFTNIDLSAYCKEKIIEVCEVKIKTNSQFMCIIAVYIPPTGNYNYFLQQLDEVRKILYSPTTCLIVCGDLNINYLIENEQKRQLDNLLLIYNLTGTVNFPTRINQTATATAIDNLIIDISQYDHYSVRPFYNDLSDHDAQILTLKTPIYTQFESEKFIRIIDKETISDFIYKLSTES